MTTETIAKSSITFQVDDVVPAKVLLPECKAYQAVRTLLGREIESCFNYHRSVVAGVGYHALLAAVYTAFSDHRPLVLGPDAVWITILQGVAHHMAIHAARLRPEFVAHEGKIDLVVDVGHFVKGSPENPWAEAFSGWSDQIGDHVGKPLHDLLVADFSTTGPVERAVSEVVMMDIFERYFHYVALCICGIPSVTLEGRVADWERLEQKVEALTRFDLDWWLEHLRPICRHFVLAAKGQPDILHWQNICKLQSDYGGDVVNGWIAKLFPYLRSFTNGPVRRKNQIFENGEGFQTADAPSGLSRVPFKWVIGKPGEPVGKYSMEAIGGLAGITQDSDTFSLRPMIGWAVAETTALNAAIEQVRRAHETRPPISREPGEPLRLHRRLRSGEITALTDLPPDMATFYHATDGAVLSFNAKPARFTIRRSADFTTFDAVFFGETVSWRGEDSPVQWCRFCEMDDGSGFAIAMGQSYGKPSDAELRDRDSFEEIRLRHADSIAKAEAEIDGELKRMKAADPGIEQHTLMTHGWKLRERSPAHRAENAEYFARPRVREEPVYPVIFIPAGTQRFNGKFSVVATSFEDFLNRALKSAGACWWSDADAVGGDVCTLMEK